MTENKNIKNTTNERKSDNYSTDDINNLENDVYEIQHKVSELEKNHVQKDFEDMLEVEGIQYNTEAYDKFHGTKKQEKEYNFLKITIKNMQEIINDYYENKLDSQTKEKTKAVESKQTDTILNEELSNKVDTIDDEYGINISELQYDKVHQYLKNIPLYKLYYSLHRFRVHGNYSIIAFNFVNYMYASFRFKGYIKLKGYNQKYPAMDNIIMADSSFGKSHFMNFNVHLLTQCKIPHSTWKGTSASMKGSVQHNNTAGSVSTIEPGILAKAINTNDELKNLLDKMNLNSDISDILYDVSENDLFQGNQVQTKRVANQIMSWVREVKLLEGELEGFKSIKDKMNDSDIKDETSVKKELQELKYLPGSKDIIRYNLETASYIIKHIGETEDDLFYDIFWKMKSTQFFGSSLITENSTQSEINTQMSKGLSQGLYNRFLFFYTTQVIEDEEKDVLELECGSYRLRMAERLNKSEEECDIYLQEEFVKLYNSYSPEVLNVIESDLISLKSKMRPYYTDLRLSYRRKGELPYKSLIKSYSKRLEYNHTKSILMFLTYLKNINFPGEKELETTAHITNTAWHSYLSFLDTLPTEKKSKFVKPHDYENLILSQISSNYIFNYEKIGELTGKEQSNDLSFSSDKLLSMNIKCYSNATEIKSAVEEKCKMSYGSFKGHHYNAARTKLLEEKRISIITKCPYLDEGFGKGINKLVIMKDNKIVNNIRTMERFDKSMNGANKW
jgi:hypothetical protein